MARVPAVVRIDQDDFFARVFADFFASADRPAVLLVWAVFLAAAERELAVRFEALFFAWDDSADFEAALWPSLLSASVVALERVPAGLWCSLDEASSRAAFFLVDLLAVLLAGIFTPARRALDRPMAIACLVERAPCFPLRTCSISSCTYSPAWVLGDLPSFLSLLAARWVFLRA
jgi:hypothetical protein